MNARRLSIPSTRLHEIEAIAERTREEAEEGARALGSENPSVFELADARVGPTEAVPNLTHDGRRQAGLLDCGGGVPRIYYEKYDPPARQRFSVAHELGHFILHHHRTQSSEGCSPENVDPPDDAEDTIGEKAPDNTDLAIESQPMEEAEADAFAAAFLLPRMVVGTVLCEFGFASEFLAERFGVSLTTMRRRLMSLRTVDE